MAGGSAALAAGRFSLAAVGFLLVRRGQFSRLLPVALPQVGVDLSATPADVYVFDITGAPRSMKMGTTRSLWRYGWRGRPGAPIG